MCEMDRAPPAEQEEWRDIAGYGGAYQASSLGNIRSRSRIVQRKNGTLCLFHGQLLRQADNGSGYKCVSVSVHGKPRHAYVHRLVAEAFIPNPDELPEINHKDEDRSNNAVTNLEWCDRKFNANYGNRALKFGISRGRPVICVETGVVYFSTGEAERRTGIRHEDIHACCSGYRNAQTAGGYHWRFATREEAMQIKAEMRKDLIVY